MERVAQPRTRQKLIPLLSADDTTKLLAMCRSREFLPVRDEAIIRLYCATGARLSEVGNLCLDDVDLGTDSVRYRGKGNQDRRVRFGPSTARAVSRHLRARAKHTGAALPELWLAAQGARPLAVTSRRVV